MTRLASRLGPLELENGYPTDATVAKIFDDIDYQRACQAYLWALPLMAMQQWQSEHLAKFGAGKLDYVDYLTFQDKLGLLTANATTPYIMAFPNLKETGPLVFEVPAGPTAGGFTDFWQRPITDSGQTGPDKGAGGRYLILGPDGPDMKPEGYYVFRSPTVNVWPGRNWEQSLFLQETNQEAPHHTQLDERTSWFYEAVGVSVGMMGRAVGVGQVYLEAAKDSRGEWLDGGKTYRLMVPKDVPVAQFWSVTVYDNETRCFVKSGVPPDRSSRDPIVTNADGSVDLTFGPSPPAGRPESNWIKTLPGKGWFSYFRLYGPTQAYFDRSWVLSDIQPIEETIEESKPASLAVRVRQQPSVPTSLGYRR